MKIVSARSDRLPATARHGRAVKLSSFISSHVEEILQDWEVAARHRAPHDQRSDLAVIRDHLGELLRAIAHDLDAPPDLAPKSALPNGEHAQATSNVRNLGERHGAGRAEMGFPLEQVVSEFPALRSCVTRLWLEATPSITRQDVEDLARFDEAVDLALKRSVLEFIESLNHSRETFLGILGHDLRNPLSAITAAGQLILEETLGDEERRTLAQRIVHAGGRMRHMISDLLDFARARLGGRMPIVRRDVDLEKTVRDTADEFASSHPERTVHVHTSGELHGSWDDRRIGQAIANLLSNAIQHGAPDSAIDLSAHGDVAEVTLAVHNEGPPISAEQQQRIFEPLATARKHTAKRGDSGHLGLGLFIAKAIAKGHGGSIEVESSAENGTTFTIVLPRASL